MYLCRALIFFARLNLSWPHFTCIHVVSIPEDACLYIPGNRVTLWVLYEQSNREKLQCIKLINLVFVEPYGTISVPVWRFNREYSWEFCSLEYIFSLPYHVRIRKTGEKSVQLPLCFRRQNWDPFVPHAGLYTHNIHDGCPCHDMDSSLDSHVYQKRVMSHH